MSLLDGLRVGLTGLNTAQRGLETAQNNVANVNTPGYARQRANIEDIVLGNSPLSTVFGGSRVTGIDGIRSRVLDARLSTAEAGLAGAEASLGYLSGLEQTLSPDGNSAIGEALTGLFGALDQLSVRPEDPALRSAVLNAARTVASKVSTTANQIMGQQADAQAEMGRRAERVNELSSLVAETNVELADSGPGTPAREALLTRQTSLVNEMARELDVRTYPAEGGRLSVTLSDGRPLVADGESYLLAVDPAPGGGVTLDGLDATAAVGGGAIGGIMATRDAALTPALVQLDALATALATEVNAQHNLGYDATGAAGGNVYALGAGPEPGRVARGITALISDPSRVAAGTTSAAGDGGNARALAELSTKANAVTIGGASTTFTGAAATLIFRAGADVRSTQNEATTAAALRAQAETAREALSGVSLDEEAADMIRFQRAFEASARFLRTVNDLLGDLIASVGR